MVLAIREACCAILLQIFLFIFAFGLPVIIPLCFFVPFYYLYLTCNSAVGSLIFFSVQLYQNLLLVIMFVRC